MWQLHIFKTMPFYFRFPTAVLFLVPAVLLQVLEKSQGFLSPGIIPRRSWPHFSSNSWSPLEATKALQDCVCLVTGASRGTVEKENIVTYTVFDFILNKPETRAQYTHYFLNFFIDTFFLPWLKRRYRKSRRHWIGKRGGYCIYNRDLVNTTKTSEHQSLHYEPNRWWTRHYWRNSCACIRKWRSRNSRVLWSWWRRQRQNAFQPNSQWVRSIGYISEQCLSDTCRWRKRIERWPVLGDGSIKLGQHAFHRASISFCLVGLCHSIDAKGQTRS